MRQRRRSIPGSPSDEPAGPTTQQLRQRRSLRQQSQSQRSRDSPDSTSLDIGVLCERVASNDPDLVTLDLSGQDLDAYNAAILGTALRMNETICLINVSDNNLEDDGVEALLEGLQHHVTLEYLFLSKNGIVSVDVLSEYLSNLPALKWVNLSDNHIRSAAALFRMAAVHPTLEQIDVRVNQIGDEDAPDLALALQNVREVNLFGNNLGDATCLVLEEAGFGAVQKLNLAYNRISNVGGKALARSVFTRQNSLIELVISGNGVFATETMARLRAAIASVS